MKLNITQSDKRIIGLSLPRWLYMNSLGVSILAMRKDVPVTPRQARKSMRAVKKAMRSSGITSMGQVEVDTGDVHVKIDL